MHDPGVMSKSTVDGLSDGLLDSGRVRAAMSAMMRCACLALTFALSLGATQNDGGATVHARGAFDVKLTPRPADTGDKSSIGQMSVAKQYHGDLDGIGTGEMLTGMTAVKDSAVYVAIERVTGTLDGRHGSFTLSHIGTMNRGAQDLRIAVVPDSGTDRLTGIAGTMSITIDKDGKHFYDFAYTLP